MVILSKRRVLSALSLILVTLAQAQFFTNVSMDRKRVSREELDDDEDGSAVSKLDGNSNWMDYLVAQQKDAFSLKGFKQLKEQFDQAWGVLTKDREALRQHSKAHSERGALRSGQGTQEQAFRRQKMLEERQRLESMLENKEVPTDIPTSNKLFELWKEKMSDRPGVRQSEKYDLVPHAKLFLHAEDIINAPDVDTTNLQSSRPARILKSVINGDEAVIHRLEEPYPSACYNHGKLAKQTQKYYMCKSLKTALQKSGDDQPFRVEQETYHMLLSNYSDQYSCYTQNVENNVCVCPGSAVDFECANPTYQKCYINITSPAFYKGCEDRPDTFYYLYSVPGFSPCYPQNFTQSIDVKFELKCQQVNANGLFSVRNEDVGYPYRDVIREPNSSPFTYVSAQPETEFSVNAVREVTVQFDFRDMKYLSQKTSFSTKIDIDDASQTNQGFLTIDFSELQKLDSEGQSRYIVGGRTYFEASVFGNLVTSFTFKGFFDEAGYEEPKSTLNKLKSSGWLYVIIAASISLVIGAIVLYCCCKAKKEQERQAKKAKHD